MKALFVIVFTLFGCLSNHKSSDTKPRNASKISDIPMKTETASFELSVNAVQKNNIEYQILEVQDSRCPKGVNCITAGKAVIKLRIKEHGKAHTYQVDFPGNELKLKTYSLKVTALNPYPEEGKSIRLENYKAKVEITHF